MRQKRRTKGASIGSWIRFVQVLALAGWTSLAGAQAPPSLGPVDLAYFGMTPGLGPAGIAWPTVPFGSMRLWDANVTWPMLEPAKGRWDFYALDRMVAQAQSNSVNVMLVLAHSPAWASARPTERSAYRAGFAAEPADMDDWRNYVRTVAARYKGRITEYQVWNEPSDKGHFTGSVAKMVELTCEAYKVLKAVDVTAKVVSPGSAGPGGHVKYLDDFLAGGGARCIDVVAHHFYVPRFGPEAMVPMIRDVRRVMANRGVAHLPLWNTETGWWIANTDGTPDPAMVAKSGWRKLDADIEAGAVIQRAFLLSRAEGVGRFYWYAWANKAYGLANANGTPKPAARYWTEAVRTMLGAEAVSCTLGAVDFACGLRKPGGQSVELTWRDPNALVRREGPAAEAALPENVPVQRMESGASRR